MAVIPKKGYSEEAMKILVTLESKEVEPSEEGMNEKPKIVAYKPKIPYPLFVIATKMK